MKKSILLFSLLLLFQTVKAQFSCSTSHTFDPHMVYNGDDGNEAHITATGLGVSPCEPKFSTCFQLTEADHDDTDAAGFWDHSPINLNHPMDFHFCLNFGDDDGGADGFTFVFQDVGTHALGDGGGYMGIGNPSMIPSVAVEFDDFDNGVGKGDIHADHIAVNYNGKQARTSPPGPNDPPANSGPVLMNTGVGNVEDGQWHDVRVSWRPNCANGTERLVVAFNGEVRIDITDNIISKIFNGRPVIYWGILAATRNETNHQQLCVNNPVIGCSTVADFDLPLEACEDDPVLLNINNPDYVEYSIRICQQGSTGCRKMVQTGWLPGPISNTNRNLTELYKKLAKDGGHEWKLYCGHTYNVTVGVRNTCGESNTQTSSVFIHCDPEVAFEIPEEVCDGAPVIMTAADSEHYDEYKYIICQKGPNACENQITSDWMSGPFPTDGIDLLASYIDLAQNNMPPHEWRFWCDNTYQVTLVLRSDCDSWVSTEKTFDVLCKPDPSFDVPAQVCDGDPVIMRANNIPNYTNYKYSICQIDATGCKNTLSSDWQSGPFPANGIDLLASYLDLAQNNMPPHDWRFWCDNTYQVTLMLSNDCDNWESATQTFEVLCDPILDFEVPAQVCDGDPVVLTATNSDYYTEYQFSICQVNNTNCVNTITSDWINGPIPANGIDLLQAYMDLALNNIPSHNWRFWCGYTYKVNLRLRNQCNSWVSADRYFNVNCGPCRPVRGGGGRTTDGSTRTGTEIQVLGNPFTDRVGFEIRLEQDTPLSLRILQTDGKVVRELIKDRVLEKGVHRESVDLSSLADGIYFYQLIHHGEVQSGRLLKASQQVKD